MQEKEPKVRPISSFWGAGYQRIRIAETQASNDPISALSSACLGTGARAAAALSWPCSHVEQLVIAVSTVLQSPGVMSAMMAICCV